MRNIELDIKKIKTKESFKILDSISNYFGIIHLQTYLPIYNKFIELNNNTKCLTNYIFNTKYQLIEILNDESHLIFFMVLI